MNKLQKKQLAFLKETISHYNKNNRCTDKHGQCSYHPSTYGLEGRTEGCAIGRHLNPELALELDLVYSGSGLDQIGVGPLPKNLRDLGLDFLIAVQKLHDVEKHWDDEGLDFSGIAQAVRIKQKFGLI